MLYVSFRIALWGFEWGNICAVIFSHFHIVLVHLMLLPLRLRLLLYFCFCFVWLVRSFVWYILNKFRRPYLMMSPWNQFESSNFSLDIEFIKRLITCLKNKLRNNWNCKLYRYRSRLKCTIILFCELKYLFHWIESSGCEQPQIISFSVYLLLFPS